MIHQLYKEQQLNCSLEEAWSFFSSANNLSKITPKEMNFIVRTDLPDDKIYKGMIIDYYVSPLLGIKMSCKQKSLRPISRKALQIFRKKDLINSGITATNSLRTTTAF